MSLAELLLIFIVALFAFGPDKLPDLARKLGRLYLKATQYKNQLSDFMYQQKQQLTLEDNIQKAKAAEKTMSQASTRSQE